MLRSLSIESLVSLKRRMRISKHYTAKQTFGMSRLVQFITDYVLKYL